MNTTVLLRGGQPSPGPSAAAVADQGTHRQPGPHQQFLFRLALHTHTGQAKEQNFKVSKDPKWQVLLGGSYQ